MIKTFGKVVYTLVMSVSRHKEAHHIRLVVEIHLHGRRHIAMEAADAKVSCFRAHALFHIALFLPRFNVLCFLAAQAAKAALYGTEELVLNERDRKEVGHDVEKRANALARERGLHGGLTLSEETADIRGGLLLRQGNIEVNCAVETLMGLYRSSLATQVANILFA